ncbi:MAG TPA: hypothetical protein DEH25_16200 [Chloroflexi bacterium]|nr:hypothetical protein [Chloroflexota bacterium]
MKVAVTDFGSVMVTVQSPVPLQAPLQLVKSEPVSAVAVRVTTVPSTKLSVQSKPQSMPLGLLVTFPVPVVLTVSA